VSDDETESWRVTAPHSDGDTRSEDEIMAEYLAGTGTVTAVDPGVSSVIEEALAAPTVMTVEEQKVDTPHMCITGAMDFAELEFQKDLVWMK